MKSCRMGRFSVRTFVCTSVRPPLWAIQPGLRPSQLGLRPSQPGLKPEVGWLGGTYKRTNERTENLPILQDFVPYRGRCPKREGKVGKKKEAIEGKYN